VRVLKRGGQLWVKCQDEIESGRQCRSQIEIHAIAKTLQLGDVDLVLLVPPPMKHRRWQRQQHARKTHSYLWVFERRAS
jgi:hypothetical protein